MEPAAANRTAAELLRIIAGFDGRQIDDFQVRAFAAGIRKYPQFTQQDWYQAIENWYLTPGARRITAGDLVGAATTVHRKRTEADRPALTGSNQTSRRPAHWPQMVEAMQIVVRDFHNQGVSPSTDDVVREYVSRTRPRN